MSFGELLLPVGGKPYFGQRPTLVHEQMHVEHGVGAEARRSPVLPLSLGFSSSSLSCRQSREGSWGTRGEQTGRGCEAQGENVRQGLGESWSCGSELTEQTPAQEEHTQPGAEGMGTTRQGPEETAVPSGTLRGQRGPRQGAEGTAVPSRALRAAAEPGPRPEGGSRQKGRAAGGGQSPARSPQPPPGPGTTGMVPRGQTSLRPPAPGALFCSQGQPRES